jgi:Alpha/beta hydrolase family
VPALFVWCREDEITPLKWGEDYAAAVPGAQLAVIEGCGHLPNLEKPEAFNRAVIEFLDKNCGNVERAVAASDEGDRPRRWCDQTGNRCRVRPRFASRRIVTAESL